MTKVKVKTVVIEHHMLYYTYWETLVFMAGFGLLIAGAASWSPSLMIIGSVLLTFMLIRRYRDLFYVGKDLSQCLRVFTIGIRKGFK